MHLVALLLVALAGCLGPSSTRCASGAVCPPGLKCVDDPQSILCVPPTCGNGATDPGEQCDDHNNVSGDGCPADCSTSCGDGLRDPEEVCDDGNTTSGDGCALDCLSAEACGNGIVDVGEECDDGARRSHDGCSGGCTGEQPTWLSFELLPPARAGAGVAYDPVHGRTLVFGGCPSQQPHGCIDPLQDLWEWDGARWSERTPSLAPAGRTFHAMAFDAARGELVVFGGCVGGVCLTPRADTWIWDGTQWSQRLTAVAPPARMAHAMAYDSARQRIVLFGGCGAMNGDTCMSGDLDDTWEWDGSTWIESATTPPPARHAHAMAYDPARGEVVMFGGRRGTMPTDVASDTWSWDGTRWLQRASSGPARTHHAMAFDAARGQVVLHGGCVPLAFTPSCSASTQRGDTWTWNGASWGELAAARTPARYAHVLAYDQVRARLVTFGGMTDTRSLAETWELDGSDWIERSARTLPGARSWHALAWDEARGVVVMFGGDRFDTPQTWEFDGVTWALRTTPISPTQRQGAAMTYDAARGVVVLFGGFDANGLLAETWEWDGASWTLRTSPTTPPARASHAMVYDAARGAVVMFGGCPGLGTGCNGGPFLADTWQWDGMDWTEIAPATSPPGRAAHGLAYDSGRDRVVMFGGANSAVGALADTWEWNGATWSLVATTVSPSARTSPAMAFDDARGEVVLVAGCTDPSFDTCLAAATDVWTWNGSTWSEELPATRPPARAAAGAAFDRARRRFVVFGGESANRRLGDTWTWDGASWRELAVPVRPPAQLNRSMAYDALRGKLVLFGGEGQGFLDDTWELDEHGWVRRRSSTAPPARRGGAVAYDAARGTVVLFGGTAVGELGDTWEWDGTRWVARTLAVSPPARFYHALAYDAERERIVLFGGFGNATMLADTWEWDGATWIAKTPASSPPARAGHTLAYDAARKRVVLFGGMSTVTSTADDTWEWDGTTWVERMPATRPPGRNHHSMAYLPERGSLIVFGGSGITVASQDLWEWNGSTWTQLAPPMPAPARTLAALAHHGARGELVLFGGAGNQGFSGETFSLKFLAAAPTVEACRTGFDGDGNELAGCADAACDGICDPLCTGLGACGSARAKCGDGLCGDIEDCRSCASDCGACGLCGDLLCDAGEVCTSCPGDCGACP